MTYGELIGGKRFNVTLTGNNIDATTGQAKLKTVQELKMVGQSPPRYDIPAQGGRLAEVGGGHEAARACCTPATSSRRWPARRS